MKRSVEQIRKHPIGNSVIPYRLIRSQRCKNVSLRFLPEGIIEIIVPVFHSHREATSILSEHSDWILKKIEEFDTFRRDPYYPDLRDGGNIRFLGSPITISVKSDNTFRSIKLQKNKLIVTLPETRQVLIEQFVILWLRHQAENTLPLRTLNLGLKTGINPEELTIKIGNQKWIWGSCSSAKKIIRLNWRLVLFPENIIDYVVFHELTHLKIPNHSREFQRVLSVRFPEHKKLREWLRERRFLLAMGRNMLQCH